jgi:hypothetical protein
MHRVTDQVNVAYLEQVPPRPMPRADIVMNLISDYIFERPLRTFLDPLLIIGFVALVALTQMDAPPLLRYLALLIVLFRLVMKLRQVWRRVRDDLALLRKGLIIRAHVLNLRPYRTLIGEIDGALLDCAIPVAPRRTYVGSIWMSDGQEALRLKQQGRVTVICLPRTPGTWRLIEDVTSEVRYDRMAPPVAIPQDII